MAVEFGGDFKPTEYLASAGMRFLTGQELSKLPEQDQQSIAHEVSDLLATHKDSMLQFTPEELITQYIVRENAVAIWDQNRSCLAGFAKNHQWPGVNEQGNPLYEFGSWLVKPNYMGKGYGDHLARLSAQTAYAKNENIQLVSVCAAHNPKPIHVLKRLGAHEIQKPINLDIILNGGLTQVVILDMSPIATQR